MKDSARDFCGFHVPEPFTKQKSIGKFSATFRKDCSLFINYPPSWYSKKFKSIQRDFQRLPNFSKKTNRASSLRSLLRW